MRLVVCICIVLFYWGTAYAQDPQLIKQRARGLSEMPVAPEGLEVSRFGNGLGHISALTGDKDGNLYVADAARGRVLRIIDRNLDGVPDISRVIAKGLRSPTGLAIIGDSLYISDAQAVWSVSPAGGEMSVFVPLGLSGAKMEPRPLLAGPADKVTNAQTLWLGLTQTDGTGKLISIDLDSRRATEVARVDASILSLAKSGKSVWVGTPYGVSPVNGSHITHDGGFDLGAPVRGLVLPGQYKYVPEGLDTWSRHILVALGHAKRQGTHTKGSQIKAIPTEFGSANGRAVTFVSGFLSPGARSGWGLPGPLWMDRRGLFVADSWSGTLWRISQVPPQAKILPPELRPEPDPEPENPAPPKSAALPLIDGIEQTPASTLKAGSQIEAGSKIETGSRLTRAWEAEKAAREAKKKE